MIARHHIAHARGTSITKTASASSFACTTSTGGVTARDAKLAAAIGHVIRQEDLPEVKRTSSQANLYSVPQNTTVSSCMLPSERIAAFPTKGAVAARAFEGDQRDRATPSDVSAQK